MQEAHACYQDMHALAVLSLTFCLVGGLVGCARSIPGDLLYGTCSQCSTAMAAHTFSLNRLDRKTLCFGLCRKG